VKVRNRAWGRIGQSSFLGGYYSNKSVNPSSVALPGGLETLSHEGEGGSGKEKEILSIPVRSYQDNQDSPNKAGTPGPLSSKIWKRERDFINME